MTRGANSGPAIMLLPPHVRASFMPNPPLAHVPPVRQRRLAPITGVAAYMNLMEKTPPPERLILPTPKDIKDKKKAARVADQTKKLEPLIEEYRQHQKETSGDFKGMNCYNTLFIGRLAYEVNEAKLLREMEGYGRVKDVRIIADKEGKSKGYAFCEFEREDDMKRAYRAHDGVRLEGRHIVVDVERGHTVPGWLPRRLGGGLGGTRLGKRNVTRPGRFDPKAEPPPPEARGPPPPGGDYSRPYGGGYGGGRGRGDRYGGPPPPPPRGGDYNDRRDWNRGKRQRSPERWERDTRGRRY